MEREENHQQYVFDQTVNFGLKSASFGLTNMYDIKV